MASNSSQKFASSGSNNPRNRRKTKMSMASTRALGGARQKARQSMRQSTGRSLQGKSRKSSSVSSSRNLNSRNLSSRNSSSIPLSSSADIHRRPSRPIETKSNNSRGLSGSKSSVNSRGSGSSNRSSRLKSKTIAQVEKEARRSRRIGAAERAKKSSRVPLIVIGSIVCVVVIAIVALFLMSKTDVLEIDNIDIKGAEHLTDQELNALASVPQGATLLNVDADSIIKSLMRDSWVQSVDVNRVFPSTLEIVIHEREVGAIVEVPSGNTQTIQNWLLSRDRVWLMALPNKDSEVGSQISERIYEDAESALHITDITYGVHPEMGYECTDEPIVNAISILTGLTTELADQIKTVKAKDVESTTLILDSNVEIAIGSADNIREKELICLDIMEKNPKVVYINVRVVDRPTWKSA